MKEAIRRRLERVADRHAEIERMLADPQVLARSDRFRDLSMEFARIDPIARGLARLTGRERELAAARAVAADPQLRALAEQEIATLESATAADEQALQQMLVPTDPLDDHNVFLEIRAAAGGDEAAIFAGDLHRMYTPLFGAPGLDCRDRFRKPRRARRLSRGHQPHRGPRRLFEAEVRIRHSPRPARAGHRVAGTDPHVDLHGGGSAGDR